MPMTPGKDESQSEFMARCVPDMKGDGKRETDQAVAACLQMWRDSGRSAPKKSEAEVARIVKLWQKLIETKQSPPDPDDDEDYNTYMERCIDEVMDDDADQDAAEEICHQAYEESRGLKKVAIVHKAHSGDVNGMEFILSDDSIDRMGDMILSDGWQLEGFKKNPIALFNHNPNHIVGKWNNLRVDKGTLRGNLQLAPEGTSPRIDEIRKLVEAGILKAVSVGFKPIETKPRTEKNVAVGFIYTKSELVETSLVSIPANSNALAVAKSLNVSAATLDLVFGGHAKRDGATEKSGNTGGHAKTKSENGKGDPMSLGQRITDLQGLMTGKREELEKHLEKMDDSNVSDADLDKTTTLNGEIAQLEKQHSALIEAEKRLAKSAEGGGNGGTTRRALVVSNGGNGTGAPTVLHDIRKKDLDPLDYVVRAGTISYISKIWNRTPEEARLKIYGDDEGTKIVSDIVLRAASAPAMTTVTGWAAELVQQVYTDMMPLLMPNSLFVRLSAKGLTLSFGRAGKIIIPTRSRTPTIAGSFVGEGQAIPVRQGAFTSQTLVPKKMAVITTWTREIDEHSIPAIEGVLREAIQVDTSVAIDSVLIDANASTTIRPAGLLNGVAATTATAGGGIAAITGDIKALVGAITAATYGNLRSLCWLMNPSDMLTASLATATNTGLFPFQAQIAAGSLNNIPIIDSATVPAKTVILIDAADFVSVGGGGPRFELSDQATLHMEDTSPADLVGPGSPGTVAAPQRSLWQTDSIALRMVMPLNWLQRRAGTIAWMQNVTW